MRLTLVFQELKKNVNFQVDEQVESKNLNTGMDRQGRRKALRFTQSARLELEGHFEPLQGAN